MTKTETNGVRKNSIASQDYRPLPDFIDVIRTGRLCNAMAAMFAEYCDCCTIHGVRYLGERRRTWIEKYSVVIAINSKYMTSNFFCTDYSGYVFSQYQFIFVLYWSAIFGLNGMRCRWLLVSRTNQLQSGRYHCQQLQFVLISNPVTPNFCLLNTRIMHDRITQSSMNGHPESTIYNKS